MPTPRKFSRSTSSANKENPSFAASVEAENLDLAAIVVHVINDDERRWIGILQIAQLNKEPPRSFTDPIRLANPNSPKKAVQELTTYYQDHPDQVILPNNAKLSDEQIVEIMGQIAQAMIRRLKIEY